MRNTSAFFKVLSIFFITTGLSLSAFFYFNGAASAFQTPHGNYSAEPYQCSKCHEGHDGLSGGLLFSKTQKATCYSCHDGSKSNFDVKLQFGEKPDSQVTSKHPVPSETLLCSSCHDPHLDSTSIPRLLAVGEQVYSSGNMVCGNCHGSDSALVGGDMVTSFVYTPHDTAMPDPESRTAIKCAKCHEPHGSAYKPLIKQEITDKNGTTTTVTGNDNTVCFGCHAAGAGKYAGKDMFNSVLHGTKSASTVALTVYPDMNYSAGQCLNCHEPHGKTGFSDYRRAEGNDLCVKCHDDSSITRPAAYSYRGIEIWNLIPHGQAATMPGSFIYNFNTADTTAWESNSMPTPASPGTPASTSTTSSAAANDGARWSTDLAAAEGSFNYQMYKFRLSQSLEDITRFNIKWVGYGEPTPGYPTELYIWDKTNGWQLLDSKQLGTEGTLSNSIASDLANFVDNNNELYLLARAKHDATPPVISSWGSKTYNTTSPWHDIVWVTDENATTYVDYGLTTSYGSTVEGTHYVKNHSARLTGLTAGQTYYYRIRSADALGNQSVKTGSFTAKCGRPELQVIGNMDQEANYTFSVNFRWNPVVDPNTSTVQYDVQISKDNFATIYKSLSDTTATSWSTTVVNTAAIETWYWRIRAKDNYGSVSEWSPSSFATEVWSCPVLYTWDGEKFVYNTDIAAGSNIGLEMSPGVYLDPIPNEQVTIPAKNLREVNGEYLLKIKNEQHEIDYIDNVVLQAIDHPAGTEIGLNDFMRAREPYKIFTYNQQVKPVKKASYVNNPTWSGGTTSTPLDVTELVSKTDNKHAVGTLFDDNQFTFDLGDLRGASEIKLVVVGWTEFATAEERSQRVEKAKLGLKTAPRLLEILQPDGTWKTEEIKHIPGYTKTAVIDLTGKFPVETKDYVVRLRGLYRPHLDFVGIDTSPQANITRNNLELIGAELTYTQPSSYSKYPAPSFDYYKKRSNTWVHEGKFTRFGDVLPLLREVDDKLVVMDTGDELNIRFKAPAPPAPGMTRSFVLIPWAYYKELSEAKVEPMPFRGMDLSSYPDSLGDYPAHLKSYVEQWNTREHTSDGGKILPPETTPESRVKLFFKKMYYSLSLFGKIVLEDLADITRIASSTSSKNLDELGPTEKAFKPEAHYSLNTNYVELEVIATDYSIPSGDCTMCHAVHGADSGLGTPNPKQLKGPTNNLCFGNSYGCHSDASNSAAGINISSRFNSNSGYTSRHSIDPTEQALYGTKVDCNNCHNPHLNDSMNKTVNPDNRFVVQNQWVDHGISNYINNDGAVYVLARAKHDGTPPVISGLTHTVNNAVYSATVSWTTNEKATRQIEWGPSVGNYVYSLGDSSTIYGLSTPVAHSLTLSNLELGKDYHYRVKSADALGNTSYSENRVVRLSAPPGQPSNLNYTPNPLPSGNAVQNVRLQWDAAVDPDGDPLQYYVELIGVNNSGWLPVGQTYWDITVSNYDTVTYSWRVKAKDSYGSEGPFSSTASFNYTGEPSPPPSCPILYTWDGQKYDFITDLVAGSNVGLELAPGKYVDPLPYEQVVIPGKMLQAKNGQYLLKVKNERDEIDFIDSLVLEAVDHPIGTKVALNDLVRGIEPYRLFTYSEEVQPVKRATYVNNPTFSGGTPTPAVDVTQLVSKTDNQHAIGRLFDDNQFTFDLGNLQDSEQIKLVIVGWTEFATAKERIERVEKAKQGIKTAPRAIEILQPDGSWKSETIKHVAGHTKTQILDLTGKFPEGTKDYVVRLRGMYRPHLDFVGVDTSSQAPLKQRQLQPSKATLQYKGVADSSTHPSPYYDYNKLTDTILKHEGKFTKYGDVLPLLAETDDKLIVMDTGDELSVSFEALPPPEPGFTRSFVLKPWAYYKELDAAKVEPMPFRDMDFSDYPNSLGNYPKELEQYIKEWNTRDNNSSESDWWEKLNSYLLLVLERVQNVIASLMPGTKTTEKVPHYFYKENQVPERGRLAEHYSLNTNYIALGIGTGPSSTTYLPNSPSVETWEKNSMPSFASPGSPASSAQRDQASNMDSSRWSTDLAAEEGAYNYQLYKFSVSEPLTEIKQLSLKWVGHGEPTPGYETALHIWNFTTNAWELVGSGQYSTDTTLNFFRNKENSGFCNKCHDNNPPAGVSMGLIPTANTVTSMSNDFHGDFAGTKAKLVAPYTPGSTRLACDDCHDPHGSSNVYHLRETINNVTNISVTQTNGIGARSFCQGCHSGNLMSDWHASCVACHQDTGGHDSPPILTEADIANCFRCHGHNKKWYGHTSCSDCHGGPPDHNYNKSF